MGQSELKGNPGLRGQWGLTRATRARGVGVQATNVL